jgi:hypothetical protein
MAMRSDCQAMLEELNRLTYCPGGKPIPLQDKHVKHLSIDAKTLLERHKSAEVIAIGLPPLVCDDRYHYAHIYIEDGYIDYRGAASVQYPRFKGELRTGDGIEEGRYYMEEAIQYAKDHWGDELRDPTLPTAFTRPTEADKVWTFELPNNDIYRTTSSCEALEFCYHWNDGRS